VDSSEQALPRRRSPFVRALSDAAKQSEERVGDAAQNGDDEHASGVLLDPRMVVFLEGDVERSLGPGRLVGSRCCRGRGLE
jgi:hypothetical protein